MSVEDMIAKLSDLSEEERRRLRDAIDRLEAELNETEEERWQRGDEALDRLSRGIVSAGGKHLSANIDEALYGGER